MHVGVDFTAHTHSIGKAILYTATVVFFCCLFLFFGSKCQQFVVCLISAMACSDFVVVGVVMLTF